MAATTSVFSVDVEDIGVTVRIPDNDVARLMYYLKCVTVYVGLDILADDLVDFPNYWRLSSQRVALVHQYAIEFSPDEFLNKLIFLDDEGEIVNGTAGNEFIAISTACDVVHVQRNIAIAGHVKDVTTVMFFRSSWLDSYYNKPIGRALTGQLHCIHCEGRIGICTCDDCPRISDSQCQSLDLLVDTLSSTSISQPSPAASSHLANCDGCGWQNFEGARYRCEDCEDFDLCQDCYTARRHDLTHRFMQIESPGSKPFRLRARTSPGPGAQPLPPVSKTPAMNPAAIAVKSVTAHQCHCDGCGWQWIEGSRYKCEICDDFDLCKDCYTAQRHDLNHRFMQIDHPETTAIHIPPRAPLSVPPLQQRGSSLIPPLAQSAAPPPPPYTSAAGHIAASPEFYYNMKVSELRDFLTENEVDHEDATDKEALSRLAWDTHCDSMALSELNIYLANNNIPTDDCRNIASRREKAKQNFKIAPPEVTPRNIEGQICENDLVVLTGLSRAEMNGKQAIVLQADCGGGRAEVHVEELGRAFKVKLENLIQWSNDADGQDDDFLD